MVASVGRSLYANVRQLFPRRLGEGDGQQAGRRGDQPLPPDLDRTAFPWPQLIPATSPASTRQAMLEAHPRPTIWCCACCITPATLWCRDRFLVRAWPREHMTADIAGAIEQLFVLGTQRTPLQDVEFLFNELVEVAVRALSPAINDQFYGDGMYGLAGCSAVSPGRIRIAVALPLRRGRRVTGDRNNDHVCPAVGIAFDRSGNTGAPARR